jgi:ribonuclease G
MYNVDDAVAKIDGYVISVASGGPYVGESTLVRIEEVGRTAATASLVDPPAAPDQDADDDGLQSKPRRRGRRGGRRRSHANAPAAEEPAATATE